VAALVSAIAGVFTVARGQAFAGHALSDVGAAGGSGSVLVGINPLAGFVLMNLAAAGVMESIGIERPRGRDLATGVILSAALGIAALFLYLDSTYTSFSNATQSILFGDIFSIQSSAVPVVIVLTFAATGGSLLLYRPLLLSTVSADLAAARGVPVRLVGVCYLLVLALAVSLTSITVGAILSTALLIGPAATALRLTSRPGAAMLAASLLGVGQVWLAVLLSFDSYYWIPDHRPLPVSFLVVTVVFTVYVMSLLAPSVGGHRRTLRRGAA